MDREQLLAAAKRLLPAADEIQVVEECVGRAPFKIKARKGKDTCWYPLSADDLHLVCKVIAGKLKIGVQP